MAWTTAAARPLIEAFDGALGAPGTVIAVACIAEPQQGADAGVGGALLDVDQHAAVWDVTLKTN